jgi:hypothetical protein
MQKRRASERCSLGILIDLIVPAEPAKLESVVTRYTTHASPLFFFVQLKVPDGLALICRPVRVDAVLEG